MPTTKDASLRLVKPKDDAAHLLGTALTDLHKALKALSFYPAGHPLRGENLGTAHGSLARLLAGQELTLHVSRKGFVNNAGDPLPDVSPMAQSLARELFIRRIQHLTFMADLTDTDLQSFLLLLALDHQQVHAAGGMEKLMSQRGITTIWPNEIDLSVIWQKRQELEAVQEEAEEEGDAGSLNEDLTPPEAQEEAREYSLHELLSLMKKESDDNRYLQLARTLIGKTETCKGTGDFAPLLPVMQGLLEQTDDLGKSTIQREYASFSLEQVTAGPATDFLLQQLEQRDPSSSEMIYRVLRQLGTKVVYVLVQRLCIASSLLARKALATAIVKIGPAAIPPLVAALQDERWYVVRNMVAILGEICSQECVGELQHAVGHADPRVRKETIRSLLNIGGKEAESTIIGMLDDRDITIVKQAILSLGLMKSQLAIQPLIGIVAQRDLFMKSLPLKKEAIQALGRIGDRRATPYLTGLLQSWHWFAWSRWQELKTAAAAALGQLGDEAAIPALKARMSAGGGLGRACGEAVDNIERLAG